MSLGLIANLAIIVFSVTGFVISYRQLKWKVIIFYTEISNLIALIASIVYVFDPLKAAPLRYTATVMLLMTILITLFVLVPAVGEGGFKQLMISDNGLYHHTLDPTISLISYLFWESHANIWAIPLVISLIYGITMFILNGIRRIDGPYPFFRVHDQSLLASVLWFIGLVILISSLCLLTAILAK